MKRRISIAALGALVAVVAGCQPDVNHGDFRAAPFGGDNQSGSVTDTDLGDHIQASADEEPYQAFAQETGILGDHDPEIIL
jgi:hypothetical protein